jgi:hypothetical protein
LKENLIMTQIDTPEKRIELRKRVWLMLMRSSEGFDAIDAGTNEEENRTIPLTRANLAKMVVGYAVNVL